MGGGMSGSVAGDVMVREAGEIRAAEPVVLSAEDLAVLREAVGQLERASFAGRLANMAGRPLEILGSAMPAIVTETVSRAADAALKASFRVALTTLPRTRQRWGSRVNTLLAAASGAAGGALGLATLPIELPVSTTLMLRAIADIARGEGEDLAEPETALACLQVFALGGGTNPAEDLTQSGYFAVRGALAKSVAQAARLMAERGMVDESAPVLMRLAAQIASRFGLVVSQKVAAGAVPIIGAIGGAAVNAAFMDHYQAMARAHFGVRRLERRYGREPVRLAYEEIRTSLA
jgi:hypothetical protein